MKKKLFNLMAFAAVSFSLIGCSKSKYNFPITLTTANFSTYIGISELKDSKGATYVDTNGLDAGTCDYSGCSVVFTLVWTDNTTLQYDSKLNAFGNMESPFRLSVIKSYKFSSASGQIVAVKK
jgi:hypothetical protein